MMEEFWIVYDIATGAELYRSSGSRGTSTFQQLPEAAALVVVPQQVVSKPTLDLDALRASLAIGVDNAAEQVRARFVTALPAQIGTYVLKEAAARAWLADHDAPVVMLQPEASARGMTVDQLANEVVALADQWATLSGAIEGLRFGAKARIAAATTVGAIAAAAVVDWEAIHAPAA